MDHIGTRIRLAREVTGMGQRVVADACEMSVAWIRRVEAGRGEATVKDRHIPILAVSLGVTRDWLLGITNAGGPVKRRDFLRQGAFVGAAASGLIPGADPLDPEPWMRLERVLSGSVGPDALTLAHLDSITVALESLQYETAPGALIGSVRGHLDELVRLLGEGKMPGPARNHLMSLAAETSGTAGWLRWDLDAPDAAAYWTAGRKAALEAGDQPLAAFLAASTSWLPAHRDDPHARIEILAGCEAHATPRTLVWILTAEAECYALEGREAEAMRCLDRADALMVAMGDDRGTRRPRMDTWDENRSLAERGAVMMRLGAHPSGRFLDRGQEAQDLLSRAVREMEAQPHMRRMALSLQVSLARARAQQGVVDGAVAEASSALDGARAMGIATIPRKLSDPTKLLRDLGPWAADPAVRQLRDQLAAA
jgi:transcriptional regulator with XRE-family HTH domain